MSLGRQDIYRSTTNNGVRKNGSSDEIRQWCSKDTCTLVIQCHLNSPGRPVESRECYPYFTQEEAKSKATWLVNGREDPNLDLGLPNSCLYCVQLGGNINARMQTEAALGILKNGGREMRNEWQQSRKAAGRGKLGAKG